ncbi:MAG: hypothetical protein ACFKPT_12110 [Gloeotrichia echinulata GP01]
MNLATKLYNACVLPKLNPLPIENRVINHSNLVSASPMHNLGNILEILTFNTSANNYILTDTLTPDNTGKILDFVSLSLKSQKSSRG